MGNIWSTFADNLSTLVEKRCRRVTKEPPPESHAQVQRVSQLLYNLEGLHHDRARGGKSALFRDVEFLLSMDNSGINRDEFIHHCWSPSGRPCCGSLEETREKMVRAYGNLFATHSFSVATLSRWVHVRTVLGIICAGFVARNIFVLALLPALGVASDPEPAAAALNIASVGAGDADKMLEHSLRKAKVHRWLSRPETPFQVASVFLATSVLDRLVYHLMGATGGGARRRPGTMAKADQPIHIRLLIEEIRAALGCFLDLARAFGQGGARSSELLLSMGVPAAGLAASENLTFMRRLCLGMSCGIFRRLELRLSCGAYPLWVLTEDTAPVEDKLTVARNFLWARECCLGYFGVRLRQLLGTEAALRGPLARLAITMWLRTLIWSVYGCEREHGSIRRLVTGTGAGPRNFSLVARERVLEETRCIHAERTEVDPRVCLEGDGTRRRLDADAAAPLLEAGPSATSAPLHSPLESRLLPWAGGAGAAGATADDAALVSAPSSDMQHHPQAGNRGRRLALGVCLRRVLDAAGGGADPHRESSWRVLAGKSELRPFTKAWGLTFAMLSFACVCVHG